MNIFKNSLLFIPVSFILHSTVYAGVIDGIQVRDGIGIFRLSSNNYKSSGFYGLALGFNNKTSGTITFFKGYTHFYSGIEYIHEKASSIIKLADEKYYSESIDDYSNNCLGIPLGLKYKVNSNEYYHTFFSLELLLGIYEREKYIDYGAKISYVPSYSYHSYSYTQSVNYNAVSRISLSLGIERETFIADKITIIRGINFSFPYWAISQEHLLGTTSSSLNVILGIGYREK